MLRLRKWHMPERREGGCRCRAVRYAVTGEPYLSLLCYCRDCQRATGTDRLPVMLVQEGDFRARVSVSRSQRVGGSPSADWWS